MIQVTDKALAQIKNIMQAENKKDHSLRIGVRSGGCSGLSYVMEFSKEILPNDEVLEVDGVKILIDVFSGMYLKDSELDFSDGLNGAGFEFKNPNAARSCGCGQSFSA
jgi:iron-sulfur cluster assembly protein